MPALYIHIPFCKRLCNYCDFYKSISLAKVDDLHRSLIEEMAFRRNFFVGEKLRTVYFGGGTPSVYAPERLQQLLDAAAVVWNCEEVEEITVETNPDDLTDQYLESLARTDINRLSVGIQSFVDRDLQMMNRRHSAVEAVEAVKRAQQVGFNNISIDLIYGIPGMSLDEWRRNIDTAIGLGVQHISAYHLTVEPNTVFGRRHLKSVDEQVSVEEYDMLCRMLAEAGFEHYEISNFALPGLRSKHNSSYWSGDRYLGLGPSAHSYDGSRRMWVVPSVGKYVEGVGTESIYEYEELNEDDRYNEFVMVCLRTCGGVDADELERLFGARKLRLFLSVAERMTDCGSITTEGGRWRIPESKWLVSDDVISEFFEC